MLCSVPCFQVCKPLLAHLTVAGRREFFYPPPFFVTSFFPFSRATPFAIRCPPLYQHALVLATLCVYVCLWPRNLCPSLRPPHVALPSVGDTAHAFTSHGSALSDQSWSSLCGKRCRVPVNCPGGLHPEGL